MEADILIIGGGIAGCATAWRLAELGHEVMLLEKGEIAAQASGQNAGMIDAKGWGHRPDLQAHFGMGGLEIFQRLQFELGYEIGFRRSGSLCAIQDEEQYDFARDQVLAWQAAGYQVELLPTRAAAAIEPRLYPGLAGVVFYPLAAQAEPLSTTRAIAAAAGQCGAHILTGQAVTAIQQESDNTFLVITETEHVRGAKLVLAAGAWSKPIGALLGLQIPIMPVRGQMWATDPLPPSTFHTISAAESWLAFANELGHDGEPPALTHRNGERICRHLYGRQRADGAIIFGGDRQLVGYDMGPDPAGIAVNHGQAAEIFPFLKGLPLAQTWAGLMPFSLDGQPLIGAIRERPGLYIVGGLSSGGFSRGPMAGQLLADNIHRGYPAPVLAVADPAGRVTELGSSLSG